MCILVFKPSANGPGVGPSPANKVRTARDAWTSQPRPVAFPASWSREWANPAVRPPAKFTPEEWRRKWHNGYVPATGIAWIEDGIVQSAHFIREWNNHSDQAYRLYADLDDAGFDVLMHFRGGGQDDMANCQPFYIKDLNRTAVFAMTTTMAHEAYPFDHPPFGIESDARQGAERYWTNGLEYRSDPSLIPKVVGGQAVVYSADGRLDLLSGSGVSDGVDLLPVTRT